MTQPPALIAVLDPALDAQFAGLPNLLTVEEVAELLRISTSSLYMWRSAGMNGGADPGPLSFKVGSRVAYPKAGVRAYLEQQLAETSSKSWPPDAAASA